MRGSNCGISTRQSRRDSALGPTRSVNPLWRGALWATLGALPVAPAVSRSSLRLGAVALLVLASACDSSDDAFSRVDLKAGQERQYAARYTGDGLIDGQDPYDMAGRVIERVVTAGRRLEGERGLTVVDVEASDDSSPGLTYRTRVWYRPTDRRLDEVAYQFSGDGPGASALRRAQPDPALPRLVARLLAERLGERPGGDDPECPFNCAVTFRDPARTVVRYPAEIGRTWSHFSVDGFLSSTREVVAAETVETPAGTFPCIVVRTRLSFYTDDEFEWVDWISNEGLVQRRVAYRRAITLSDGSAAESVATERLDLVSVSR